MQVGTLEEIIDDDHAIVSTGMGPEYYVNIMSFVDKDELEPGCSVFLHNKDHSVVGILAEDSDPMVNVMKLEKAPQETYADIGGLEQQIQEIKVIFPFISASAADLLGVRRIAPHSSRALRRNGHQTTKGSDLVWTTGNGQDSISQGSC